MVSVLIEAASSININSTVIPVLIAVLSSGFIFGLFRVMPERKSILVQASENAVKVVNEAIGTLQKELQQARSEIARLEGALESSKEQRVKVEAELLALQTKVARLETQLEIYERIRSETNIAARMRAKREEIDDDG